MAGPPGSTPARSLQHAASAEGLLPLVGPFHEPVARLSGPPAQLDEAGAAECGDCPRARRGGDRGAAFAVFEATGGQWRTS
jgi:hypothetical protein